MIRERVDYARYQLQHRSLAALFSAGVHVFHKVIQRDYDSTLDPSVTQRQLRELLEQDWDNARLGLYPRELLFQYPYRRYLRALPEQLADFPRTVLRRRKNDHSALPRDADLNEYPEYYRRNFHWQTDGWLSRRSARLYDPAVEFLFLGTADIMRRMAIPPLTREFREPSSRPRILDIACGTGRFLSQLHRALPKARLTALDLSPFYLQEAREVLADVADVNFVTGNAESMPVQAGSFDAAVCIFLFHELPSEARRNVVKEAFKAIKPGGLFILADSVQLCDRTGLDEQLKMFPKLYHEPFYRGYLSDPLEDLCRSSGFTVERTDVRFLTKILTCRRPSP